MLSLMLSAAPEQRKRHPWPLPSWIRAEAPFLHYAPVVAISALTGQRAGRVLDEALKILEAQSERQARVVECRFFAGYSVSETADILETSERTVKREWAVARTRLFQILKDMLEA